MFYLDEDENRKGNQHEIKNTIIYLNHTVKLFFCGKIFITVVQNMKKMLNI